MVPRVCFFVVFCFCFWGVSTNLKNCAIIFSVRLCEPIGSFFSTALLWSSCSLTDSINDVADNCLDREYAHNAYN